MKWLKKHWFKLLSFVLISFVGIYVFSVAISKARDHEIYKEPSISTKIYTIWHTETFEGGGKSRINYIKSVAREIESSIPGVLFMIKTVQPQALQTELEQSVPDIISFGFGVGKIVLPYLKELNTTFNVRDELMESGSFNSSLYALPYIVSGYAKISHSQENSEFHCGETGYTNPELIYNLDNVQPIKKESQYEAYKSFVYNKNSYLLGTARDVYRVNNLNNIGRTNAFISPINTYSDLIQYIGICSNDEITNKFLSLALSEKYQNSLVNYSLFSAKYNKLYNTGIYNDMENAIFECSIAKVFDENN